MNLLSHATQAFFVFASCCTPSAAATHDEAPALTTTKTPTPTPRQAPVRA